MVTGELKNKIDSIWETLWTSGLTNSMTVLEQITYLIFIKLLDDNQLQKERDANTLHIQLKEDDKTFKNGIYEIPNTDPKKTINYSEMRWNNFHNLHPDKMQSIISEYVFPFIKNLNSGSNSSFSTYMENAVYIIPTAQALGKVVSTIDSIDMTDMDVMGDVYEYLLSKMAESGNNGQFRTPRHIINMMVNLMKPTVKDKILDPAMGSAGFLVGCANYISTNYKKELIEENNNNFYKTEMLTGYDTDPTMLRIGAMNLMLHGIDNPNVKYRDSLSKENTERNKYDLIMANPPFKGKLFKENVSDDLTAICNSSSTELLFLALFTKMLKIGGRCASVVPEGVLFGSNKAHRSIREELINHQRLKAVISMPSGVFKPYAGVSTAILIFDRTDSGGTDKVWFYDMHADGYSLDDKREPIDENDIPDILVRFENPEEENRTRKDQSFFVSKQEIIDNDYNLTIKTYKENEYIKENLPEPKIILDEIKNLEAEIRNDIVELEKLL